MFNHRDTVKLAAHNWLQPVLHGLLDKARDYECNSSDMQQLEQWLNSKQDPLLKVVFSCN